MQHVNPSPPNNLLLSSQLVRSLAEMLQKGKADVEQKLQVRIQAALQALLDRGTLYSSTDTFT